MRSAAFILVGFLGLILGQSVGAATLYLEPNNSTINLGDSIEVVVRLDTNELEGECVNSVEGVLTYGPGVLPVDVSLGESIFSLWIEPPTINTEAREITFAGGIPNGYCGRIVGDPRLTNILMTLIFRAPGFTVGASPDGASQIAFTGQTKAYLNDGLGTVAELRTLPATITVNQEVGNGVSDPWRTAVRADTFPPEEFSITLDRDELAFGGRYFIAFNTTDKQSGIDHYEVIEEPMIDLKVFNWGASDAPWIDTRSPYILDDQTLNSIIRVKAVDKAGNQYVATLVPDESLRTITDAQRIYQIFRFVSFGFGTIILLGVLFFVYRRYKKLSVQEVESVAKDTSDYDT